MDATRPLHPPVPGGRDPEPVKPSYDTGSPCPKPGCAKPLETTTRRPWPWCPVCGWNENGDLT